LVAVLCVGVLFVLFLPLILVARRRQRRRSADRARELGVRFDRKPRLSIWRAMRMAEGRHYVITDKRVIVYNDPVVQIVDRSRIVGLDLSRSGESDSTATLVYDDWRNQHAKIELGGFRSHRAAELLALAAPDILQTVFSEAANGQTAKQIAGRLAGAEPALGYRYWTPTLIRDLIATRDVREDEEWEPWSRTLIRDLIAHRDRDVEEAEESDFIPLQTWAKAQQPRDLS
jgi:hypothetical protein